MTEYGAAQCYDSVEPPFRNPEIDAVILCLPHHLHSSIAIQAAQHGKDCLVEKPLCTSVAEADAMIRAADENGTYLMVAHVLRFQSINRKAKEVIRAGAIGKPLHVIERRLSHVESPPTPWWSSTKQAGGLALALNGSHSVDTILWMLGERPASIHAVARSYNPQWEGEDDFDLSVVTENETLISIHHSFNSRYRCHDCVVIGSDGTLVTERSTLSLNGEKISVPTQDMFYNQLQHFVQSILNQREPHPSAKDVRDVVVVLEGARDSMAAHSTVVVKERFAS